MKKNAFLGLICLVCFFSGFQLELQAQQRVTVTIQRGPSVDDLSVAVHPWRIHLVETRLQVSLAGGNRIFKTWEINNTNPDKATAQCPAFDPINDDASNSITFEPFPQGLPTGDVLCKYTIVLWPRDGSEPISVDPEYRIGPHGLGPSDQ